MRAGLTLILVPVLVTLPAAGLAQTGIVRLAITRDEGSLNPYTYQSGYPGWNIMTLVYDPLFYPDANNEPIPWLVREVRVSGDGRTWTLSLHPNLRWHDGRALTSEDVKFTFEYVQKVTHSRWTPTTRNLEGVDAPNPQTVVFRLKAPHAGFRLRPLADALLPISTVFMLNLGFIASGATVIETVFSCPVLGRLLYEAVLNRDYPVIQATFLILTVSVIAANVLADLLYPLIDPRVRHA